ncbi:MAG TPA: Gfo/Idh/MocA family oxidoreductase [Candidatus Binatia bacterium]|jgi:predicted dehydrogenase|nr:Gfo/Idh/MocA family oxidoreductase [Candidatus Binatia bacterium]
MKIRVAGINFDHMHMGDLLRMAFNHPQAEIVGLCDEQPERMQSAIRNFNIPAERVFSDVDQCLIKTRPDFVILCPATARHAEYVERVAPYRVHLLVEKPFAASVAEADRMFAAARRHRVMLAINWPLRWSPSHCTAYRLLLEGRIGPLEEVHYYGGNRGPLWHTADKIETKPTPARKRKSWFYTKAQGGGSLLDYLGYGATLGTWFHQGRAPLEVTAVAGQPKGLEVDEHSITIARYTCGLSKFETRWGTFTDPWTFQPQPKCGFVLKGADGTISSYDYEPTVRLQTRKRPAGEDVAVDVLKPPFQNPIQYFIDCLRRDGPPEGPLSPKISRIGQQLVDSALLSARLKKNVKLVP